MEGAGRSRANRRPGPSIATVLIDTIILSTVQIRYIFFLIHFEHNGECLVDEHLANLIKHLVNSKHWSNVLWTLLILKQFAAA